MSFESDLQKAYEKKVEGGLVKAMRECAFVLNKSLTEMTPVDTGLASSNWIPTLNIKANHTVGIGQKVEAKAVASKATIKDIIWNTNNIVYIQPLEDGHSKRQAPSGFVQQSLQIAVGSIK